MKTFLCGFLECVKCGASVVVVPVIVAVVVVVPAAAVVVVVLWNTLKCLHNFYLPAKG